MIGLFVKDLYLFLFKSYFVLQSFCFYFFLRGRGVLKYYVFNLVAVRIMFVRGHLSEKIITHGNHYLHHMYQCISDEHIYPLFLGFVPRQEFGLSLVCDEVKWLVAATRLML